ncbi:MAG: XRE family transcriptional regulator [Candidatus Aminicenantes bacterium]|nr:XRE family transcriptional regulator [Candidatus Aminicenantes bacterium]
MSKNKDLIDFGNRLRSARKMSGLSMEDLVKKAKGVVTKQSISKYEKGIMKPSSDVLIRLASALSVKPEFFFRHTTIDIFRMQFRKRANLSIKIIESLKQRTIDFLERYIELESILGIQEKFSNPLSNFAINSLQDVENAALKLRVAWELGLAPISNFLELLEENAIRVYEVQNIDDFDGLSARVGDLHVIVINRDLSTDRIRFTAAHELAHILCEFPKGSQKEKLCHAFAGAFLLPKAILERELMKKREQITLWELEEIKQTYGISIQAIVKRAHMLGIVSDFYYRNFQLMLNRKGWKKKEPVEYQGREEAIRFKQLLHYCVSEKIITLSRGAELANISFPDFMENVRAAI